MIKLTIKKYWKSLNSFKLSTWNFFVVAEFRGQFIISRPWIVMELFLFIHERRTLLRSNQTTFWPRSFSFIVGKGRKSKGFIRLRQKSSWFCHYRTTTQKTISKFRSKCLCSYSLELLIVLSRSRNLHGLLIFDKV